MTKQFFSKLITITIIQLSFLTGDDLVNERSWFARTWETNNGQFITKMYVKPVCYQNNGSWVLISENDTLAQNIARDQYMNNRTQTVNVFSSFYGSISREYSDDVYSYYDTYGPYVGKINSDEYRGYIIMDFESAIPDGWEIDISNIELEINVISVEGGGVNNVYTHLIAGSPTNISIPDEQTWNFLNSGTSLPSFDGNSTTSYLLINQDNNSNSIGTVTSFLDGLNDDYFTIGFVGSTVTGNDQYTTLDHGSYPNSILSITYERETTPLPINAIYQNDVTGVNNIFYDWFDIKNNVDNEWNSVYSINDFNAYINDSYTLHPQSQFSQYGYEPIMHHHWAENIYEDPFSIEIVFTMNEEMVITAYYKNIYYYSFETNQSNSFTNTIELSDPWRKIENEYNQTNEFFSPTGEYAVFKNQNSTFDDDIPIYRLRTDETTTIGDFTYEFINWSGDADFNENNNELETDVVFTTTGGTVTANYDPHFEVVEIQLLNESENILDGIINVYLLEGPEGYTESISYDGTMFLGATYKIVVEPTIESNYLYNWNDDMNERQDSFTFTVVEDQEDIIVNYKERFSVNILSELPNQNIELFDPWNWNENNPEGTWGTSENGQFFTFLNNPEDSDIQYKLRTDESISNENDPFLYQFDLWTSTNADIDNSQANETDVNFLEEDAQVEAQYNVEEVIVNITLENIAGNELIGQVIVELSENPITGEIEEPEYDNTMYIGGTYTFTVPEMIEGLYLHDWNGNIQFENNTFTVAAEAGMNDIVVRYKEKIPVTITSNQPTDLVMFDPWALEEGTPSTQWVSVNAQSFVFLNETTRPYKIHAPLGIQSSTGIPMVLSGFDTEQAAATPPDPEIMTPISVVFENENATVTAIYQPAEGGMTGVLPPMLTGQVFVYDQVIVPERTTVNGSLIILPGTEIQFESRGSLTINGSIYSLGNSAFPVHINGSSEMNVMTLSGGSSESEVTGTYFNGVTFQVTDDSSFPYSDGLDCTIRYSSFTGNTVGLWVNNYAEIDLKSSSFYSPSQLGLFISGLSSATVDGCTFDGMETAGIVTYLGGEVRLKNTSITQTGVGVWTDGGTFADLTHEGLSYCWEVNNEIYDNDMGCLVASASRQTLGVYYQIQTPQNNGLEYIGYNRLYDNGLDIHNRDQYEVKAQGNSWKDQNSLPLYTCDDGNPNVDNHVLILPNLSEITPDGPPVDSDPIIDELNGQYENAIMLYQSRLQDAPSDTSIVIGSLSGLARSYTKSNNIPSLLTLLSMYEEQYPNTFIEKISLSLQASFGYHTRTQVSMSTALSKMDIMYTKYPETQSNAHEGFKEAKLRTALEGMAGNARVGDDVQLLRSSKDVLKKLKTEFKNEPAGMIARYLLTHDEDEKETAQVLPSDYSLYSAYPNPFNPATTLKYDIPENSHIKLTVFDLSGRVVTELMNQNIMAGTHHSIWNGTNTFNERVSSGMYIVQMEAISTNAKKHFTNAQKVVLLK